MLLLWALLLCWGMPPQARGTTHRPLFLRINKSQLETEISDLLEEHEVLKGVIRMTVTGSSSEGVSALDRLPFVRNELVGKKSGLDLSLVGDLLSGKTTPELKALLKTAGLVIEDAKGPEVTLQILSDSLLQITLRCKLYLSFLEILWLEAIKNIRIGVRLEQIGNKTQVAFEECHAPPGSLNIEILKRSDTLLTNQLLKLVTNILEESLPFLLQKIVCPVATNLINFLLEDMLHIILPPVISGPNDFQYYLTTTEFTEGAILMRLELVTPCGPHQRAPRSEHTVPPPLPGLSQSSMADFAFWLEIYNDILACLYTSQEIFVEPWDSSETGLWELLSLTTLKSLPEAYNLTRGSLDLIISAPDPPTVHLDGYGTTVTQQGLLMLQGTNASSGAVAWSAVVTLGPYPTITEKQEERLKTLLLAVLKRWFLPHHNRPLREWLSEHSFPLANIKGISFSHAQMDFSEWGT
ncbi:BPI fold-containing family B, member 5 [Apodemus speciosus]|uniref:BPI fold-containing family B, member 5 n=1 Tax=Apodemus speciosus TaxID=105296 RepID=A0ABQ0EK05_APOSI